MTANGDVAAAPAHGTPYKHTANFAAKHRTCFSHASLFYKMHSAFFAMDIYGYSPSLMAAQFKTVFSLVTSIVVYAAWITAVVYTTYNWTVAPPSQSETTNLHDQTYVMLPPSISGGYGASQLNLPMFGVLYSLSNQTYLSFNDSTIPFILTYKQSTVCNGNNNNKFSDSIPFSNCAVSDSGSGVSQVLNSYASCTLWDNATASLINSASYTPTCVPASQSKQVPRVVGTFTNSEYSYLTATVSMNPQLLNNATFANLVYSGAMQVFLMYNYTTATDLSEGVTNTMENNTWSVRVNPASGFTVKAEIALMARRVKVDNFYWNLKALAYYVIDSQPVSVVNYVSAPSYTNGYIDVAKVFMRFNDQDSKVEYVPPGDLVALLSGWGGLLALLLKIGLPAAIINKMIFDRKVKKMIKEDNIQFDEPARLRRQKALSSLAFLEMDDGEVTSGTKGKNSSIKPDKAPGAVVAVTKAGPVAEAVTAMEGESAAINSGVTASMKQAAGPSLCVNYNGDIFADEDKEQNLVDVLRHATSECNALFHLRQVVKLVDERSPQLTLWGDQLARAATEDEVMMDLANAAKRAAEGNKV